MRRGWVVLVGVGVALSAIYVLLTGVSIGGARDIDHEIDERSRQDLRELLRESGEAG